MKRSPLLIIFVTVFIDLLGFGIVMPLLPRYGKFFGADKLTLGLLMASFSAMQFLFAPLWGRLSDRIGRRPVLLLGLAGSTVFYGLFGVATVEQACDALERINADYEHHCRAARKIAEDYFAAPMLGEKLLRDIDLM